MNAVLDPLNHVKPYVEPGVHPVESTRYLIATPPVNELCKYVVRWVRDRVTGAIVYAPPRHGKTSALDIIRLELGTKFPGIPIVTLPAWDYVTPSEKSFLGDLLSASGHALAHSGDASARRPRVVQWFTQLAETSSQGRLVLLIDEAQNLQEKHYRWLMGIHNLMKQRTLNLIVILVGQEELIAERAAYVNQRKQQIVGRFMLHTVEYSGLRTVDHFRSCLRFYDIDSRYPIASDWSFTRYFLSEWFDAGGRLERLAEIMLASFKHMQASAKAKTPGQIPMQYFCRTVEFFLRHNSKSDLNDTEVVRAAFNKAITESGYLDVLLVPLERSDISGEGEGG